MTSARLVMILACVAGVGAACEQRGSEPTAPATKSTAVAPPEERAPEVEVAGEGTEAAGQAAAPEAEPSQGEPAEPVAAVAATDPWRGPVVEQYETDGGVIVEDLKIGEGEAVRLSDAVRVHYRGMLADGREFDSSWSRNEPASFYLTQNIVGWREGMPGMKVGGLRRMIIPAELGYGRAGTASVPPNSMLIFEVELLEIIR
jgi:FKBP-type peptidyl-prolyl cis-trans isomerase FkpA